MIEKRYAEQFQFKANTTIPFDRQLIILTRVAQILAAWSKHIS